MTNELEKAMNKEMGEATSQEEKYKIYEKYMEMIREMDRINGGGDDDVAQHAS